MDEDLFYRINAWKGGAFHLPRGIVERDIHETACRFLDEKEILTLLGLRQTGKSTLVFQLIFDLLQKGVGPERIFYFTFDDLSFRQELAAVSKSGTPPPLLAYPVPGKSRPGHLRPGPADSGGGEK